MFASRGTGRPLPALNGGVPRDAAVLVSAVINSITQPEQKNRLFR
jgi:hypothetical protein